MKNKQKTVERIREFNRFYTVLLGILYRNYMDSGYSVTGTRILFELSLKSDITAQYLVEYLKLDKGYMSRTVRLFEEKGLIARKENVQDKRAYILTLTDDGYKETQRLIAMTNEVIENLIGNLDEDNCKTLVSALDIVTEMLQ